MVAIESRNGHANGNARRATPPLDTVSDGAGGVNGHGSNGRFTAGNRCAAGNPFARRMARLRSALLDAVSDVDFLAVARKLVEQAKGGDTAAAKLLLAYLIGKPGKAVDPDLLDRDEWQQVQEWPLKTEVSAYGKLSFRDALTSLRAYKQLGQIVPLFTAEGLALLEATEQLAKLMPRGPEAARPNADTHASE